MVKLKDPVKVKIQEVNKKGWSCPICGHVWGPQVDQCIRCNAPRVNTSQGGLVVYNNMK